MLLAVCFTITTAPRWSRWLSGLLLTLVRVPEGDLHKTVDLHIPGLSVVWRLSLSLDFPPLGSQAACNGTKKCDP